MKQYLSLGEFARHVGVLPGTLAHYKLPEPDAMIGATRGWLGETVDAWQAARPDNFYFDKLRQNRLPNWSSGRVSLIGDAAYCSSPAAGMGGSVAILGATALYDAFLATGGDIKSAFAGYERSFRPTAERIQQRRSNSGCR